MTKLKLIALSSVLLVAGAAGFAFAKDKDGDRSGRRAERKAAMLEKYDANDDGELDDAERAAMKKARAAEKFAKLDTNKDGVLSLAEFEKANHGGRHGKHKRR
jgi:Ca2+-binding EF-hand superfamily protein